MTDEQNFSEHDKQLLLNIVKKYTDILDSKKTTVAEKNECWKRIAEQFNTKTKNTRRSSSDLKEFYNSLNLNQTSRNLGKVLPHDPKARRLFVTTGGLKKVQEIEAEPGSTLMEYITIINACFPEEIVRYYSPNYPESLLDAVEQYQPQAMTILREIKTRDSEQQANISGFLDDLASLSSASQFM